MYEKEQTTIGGTVPFLFKTDVICDYLFCKPVSEKTSSKPINNIVCCRGIVTDQRNEAVHFETDH